MNLKQQIKHPDWLQGRLPHLQKTLFMIERGEIPESIRGSMLTTDAKFVLRCIYGSRYRALWALFKDALAHSWMDAKFCLLRFWRYTLRGKDPNTELKRLIRQMELEEEDEDGE